MVVQYTVDPGGAFKSAVNKAIAKGADLTQAFILITQSWYKGNQAIFQLQGPGKYQDLNDSHTGSQGGISRNYKYRKFVSLGFVYPILRGASGALEGSITDPVAPYAIAKIVNKQGLILGSAVPYGAAHQFGAPSRNLPARPFVLTGAEQTAPGALNNRIRAWTNIIKSVIAQSTKDAMKGRF